MIIVDSIKESDLPELSVLLEELTELKSNLKLITENYKYISNNENYILLGAKYNDKLVGTLMAVICRDLIGECRPFMVIENVIVDNTHRGKGIGKLMINEIEKRGKARDCFYSMLVSGQKRTGAHKFYESAGYCADPVKGFRKYF